MNDKNSKAIIQMEIDMKKYNSQKIKNSIFQSYESSIQKIKNNLKLENMLEEDSLIIEIKN